MIDATLGLVLDTWVQPMKQFKDVFQEMPQHYKGEIVYLKDDQFREISINNIHRMDVLDEDNDMFYLIHPKRTLGFVFDKDDFTDGVRHVRPVMSLALRDVNEMKQVRRLSIRIGYSQTNITTRWYQSFVNTYGSILSKNEHLEGGQILWRSFINSDAFQVDLLDLESGEYLLIDIPPNTPDDVIWNEDQARKNLVMILSNK